MRALGLQTGVQVLHLCMAEVLPALVAGSERNAIKKKGKKIDMVAYIRFDDLENRSKTVDKISHVMCRVQDVHNFDDVTYETYHVDCIKSDGKIVSLDNVLDIMVE